ncbi:MAG: hypothetical protein U1C19_11800, partial [Methanobacteriaceae archaeon]|nr:hypothetical protein [Methanobacteriaceae archaeon]
EIRKVHEEMEEIYLLCETAVQDYKEYLKGKNSFYINLQNGYYGKMTCFENYLELLPIDEGKTGIIYYKDIRKLAVERCESSYPDKADFMDFLSFNGIYITLYLHSGEKYVIEIFNTIMGYKDPSKFSPGYVDCEGYYNFYAWFEDVWRSQYSNITYLQYNNKQLKNDILDFHLKILDYGCEMDSTLANCVKNLFNCTIEERIALIPFDLRY